MNRVTCVAAFAAGLAVVSWVGAGYIGTSPLALAVIVLIGVVYLVGAFELWRFDRATDALDRALQATPHEPKPLADWLDGLPATLRNPVRLRIDGERVGLPGPALTPYLVGLLVLLGMLGTFLGMVVTLHGAVAALETTTDLQAIRSALAAPVKGLGFAFGTSVAGVAASAMLGLVSALCRRARLRAAQLLDSKIATSLRAFSFAHRRDRTFDALQLQASALPELVGKLETIFDRIERQGREANERLVSEQQRFHDDARLGFSGLAESVGASLKTSLAESARLAGEAIRPAVSETMAAIAGQTSELQSQLAGTVERQLDGVSARFDTSVAAVAQTWTSALASHERSAERLNSQLQHALSGWTDRFEQGSAALFSELAERSRGLYADIAERSAQLHTDMAGRTAELHTNMAGRTAELHAGLAQRAAEFHASGEERSTALLASIGESARALHVESASADQARQAALAQALEAMAVSLQREWEQMAERSLAGQQHAFQALGENVREIATTAQTQAARTVDEVARLMESAAQAPRAAAEVIGRLREELSASIARDNELLAERGRILEALGTLSISATQAATEQRDAIGNLVSASTVLLERVGERLTDSVDAQSARIVDAADQVTVGAVEVASLGEALGHAVQLFGESSDKLTVTLQRIEGALEKSTARSDEQLAYYVAQAREIIDLSIASQRQVVEDLGRLAGNETSLAAAEAIVADQVSPAREASLAREG